MAGLNLGTPKGFGGEAKPSQGTGAAAHTTQDSTGEKPSESPSRNVSSSAIPAVQPSEDPIKVSDTPATPVNPEGESQSLSIEVPPPAAISDESLVAKRVVHPAVYSSHPVDRFRLGRKFQFVKGQLKFDDEESQEHQDFLRSLKGADVKTRQQVKRIDVRVAEALIAARKPVATKSVDSAAQHELAGKTEIGKVDVLSGKVSG